ncbi:hypothetical protein SLEP1_g22059 [Rubroshorea leprosula]|uniref:Uncharacterized protein n=1 Tax=Rubroshorea leprosula TaxID=152421 RepID=A0AAV5JE06_9ROSI|nr:hypothetical protein SLEP1_g22059 [Rubroshorea leprosula]
MGLSSFSSSFAHLSGRSGRFLWRKLFVTTVRLRCLQALIILGEDTWLALY